MNLSKKIKNYFTKMPFLKEKLEIGLEEAELKSQKTFSQFPPKVKLALIIMSLAIIPGFFITKILAEAILVSKYQKVGFTAKPSFTNPQAPEISETSFMTLGPNAYAAVVQISNQNLDLSSNNIPYQFNFYNQQRQKIYTYSDKLFLLPNETKYISAPRFNSNDQVAFSDFKLTEEIKWQKRLNIPKVQFITDSAQSYQQLIPPAFVVEGAVINNSPYILKQARLTFVLFDSKNKIVGLSRREEFTIGPFERRAYKQLWPNFVPQDFNRVEVFAETDTLDVNNLLVINTSAGSAGDLSRPEAER